MTWPKKQCESVKEDAFDFIRMMNNRFYIVTDIEILMDKIMNKELNICETCDNIFDYVPQKIYCDECIRKNKRKNDSSIR